MPMPAVLTQNGTGTSAIWQPDWMQSPFNIAIGTIVTGGAGYSVEFTLDNLAPATATASTWYTHATISALSVSTTGNIQFPVRGLRLNVITAASIASSVTVNFIQATYPGS
jgi:hypothetical protein